MKVAGTVLLIAALVGGWWLVSRKTVIPGPSQVVQATPMAVSDTVEIPAGKLLEKSWSPPQGKTPGLFQGRWDCSGKAAGIKGANDDTLVGFKLRGPDNKIIQTLDHPTSGNFSIRFETPGVYTFVFDNSGIIRSSARRVVIKGTYQPD